jgi:ribosomal protein L34E
VAEYRIPPADAVRDAAREVIVQGGRGFPSQAAFRAALLSTLRKEERRFALGGRRMRHLLVNTPGVRLHVLYALRPTRRPMGSCPICGAEVRPIRNHTLLGDEVTLGYRCGRCGYWTHLARRVPVRYRFLPGSAGSSAPVALRGTS